MQCSLVAVSEDYYPARATATVGAGDALNGGVAAALVLGQDLVQAVRLGTAAGAFCATKEGAQTAMPTMAELEVLMAGG